MITRDAIETQICRYFGENIRVADINDGVQVVMPLSDRFGDLITVVIDEGQPPVVTDAGAVLYEVGSLTGAKATDPVWGRVREIAHRRGLEWTDGELWMEASADGTGIGKALINVAVAIRDIIAAEQSRVPPVQIRFQEEVQLFLEDNQVPFTARQVMKGASGTPHRIDFVLMNDAVHVAQAVASELSMRRSVNIFYDLLEADTAVQPIAFLDPTQPRYSNETFQQLAFKARIFNWAAREEFMEYWSSRH